MSLEICPLGVSWADVRGALVPAADRVATLIEGITEPGAPAVGAWTAIELAVHLSHPWMAMPALAARDREAVGAAFPDVSTLQVDRPSGSLLAGLDDLAPLTLDLVAADPERDPEGVAARIRAAARAFFAQVDADPDHGGRPWMVEPIRGAPAYFACHLLSETLVHGHDLARARGIPWQVEDADAALVVRGFLLPVLAALSGRRPPVPALALDLRLAGDRRVFLHGGPDPLQLSLGAPIKRPSARMWVRPSALLLLGWGRLRLPEVVRRRQMLVWGTRPWTASRLLGMGPRV